MLYLSNKCPTIYMKYPRSIQPIFDKYTTNVHNQSKRAGYQHKEALALSSKLMKNELFHSCHVEEAEDQVTVILLQTMEMMKLVDSTTQTSIYQLSLRTKYEITTMSLLSQLNQRRLMIMLSNLIPSQRINHDTDKAACPQQDQ